MLVKLKRKQLIIKITASCFVLILAVFLLAPAAQAQLNNDIQTNLELTGEETTLSDDNPIMIAGRIIKVALGLVGAIALIIVIYAGFLYMTSGGDPAKTAKAIAWLRNGLIGLVIIFLSYAIASFVINSLLGEEPGGGVTTTLPTPPGFGLSGGAFGSVIQSHFPQPEQEEVARNTMIMVTFRIPIDPESVVDTGNDGDCPAGLPDEISCGSIKPTFKVFRCDAMPEFEGETPADCLDAFINDPADSDLVPGYGIITEDRRTVVFNPYGASVDHLGSSAENVSYIVYLMPGIERDGGSSIFTTATPDYKWRFTTGTFLDEIPPQVLSVIPVDQAGIDPAVNDVSLDDHHRVYLNQIVVANFDEPVIPLFAQTQECTDGDNDNEAQLKSVIGMSEGCSTGHIKGNWQVGINNYQTIQFISSTSCGADAITSCGEEAFCLPANRLLAGLLKAPSQVGGISEFGTGIMDIAGNGMVADYNWQFQTGDSLDLLAPYVESLNPKNSSEDIPVDLPLRVTFNEGLEPQTMDTEVYLLGEDFVGWFDPNFDSVTGGFDVTTIKISHGNFSKVAEGELGPVYSSVIKSGLRDLRQNCFTPSRHRNEARDDSSVSMEPHGNDALQCGNIADGSAGFGTSCCPNINGGANYRLEKEDGDICELPGVGTAR